MKMKLPAVHHRHRHALSWRTSSSLSSLSLRFMFLLLLIFLGSTVTFAQRYDCDPCVDRSSFTIQMIVHAPPASNGSGSWQPVLAAASQAGADVGVDLQIQTLSDATAEQDRMDEMAAMIRAIIALPASQQPQALIVTLPSPAIVEAVEEVMQATGIPVFGLNSGYQMATTSLGLLGFVAMDERLGGVEAALETIRQQKTPIRSALFVNQEAFNTALVDRYQGYNQTLFEQANVSKVDQIVVDLSDEVSVIKELSDALKDCAYDAVLASSLDVIGLIVSTIALTTDSSLCTPIIGTFDTNAQVYDLMARDKVTFAIDQQPYLQGALPVILASLYATTGKTVSRPLDNDYGVYLSGPKIVNKDNLPTTEMQQCIHDAFPVCSPDTLLAKPDDGDVVSPAAATTTTTCPCQHRANITIGGVLHGVTTDGFWDQVFVASRQAAVDYGIELLLDRLEPQPTTQVWYNEMATRIRSYCYSDDQKVDGLFVTLPSPIVVEAVQECLDLGVPVVVVNAGETYARDLNLGYIAQTEKSAGYLATVRMIQAGATTLACLAHEPDNQAIIDRCQGFDQAIQDAMNGNLDDDGSGGGNNSSNTTTTNNLTNLGFIPVPADDVPAYQDIVEKAVNRTGDWAGVGLLALGSVQAPAVLKVQEMHPAALIGSFDTSVLIYEAIEEGRILFGINQNEYLQGYLPIPTLVWGLDEQVLVSKLIASGPGFVENALTDAEKTCVANHYLSCAAIATPAPTPAPATSGAGTIGILFCSGGWAASLLGTLSAVVVASLSAVAL